MIKRLLFILFQFLITQFTFSQVDDTTYQTIEEVKISAKREKQIVFEDPKYYIIDFSVADSNALLLMRNFQTYYLYDLDESMNFRHKLKLTFDANFLFDDCHGNTYVVSRDSVFFIYKDQFGLYLTEGYRRSHFMRAMERCVGSTSQKVVFKSDADEIKGTNQTYYTIDNLSKERSTVYELKDNDSDKRARKVAAQLYLMKKLDKKITDNDQSTLYSKRSYASIRKDIDAHHLENAYYNHATFVSRHVIRPEYHPLFTLDDTLYIFNHYEGEVTLLDQEGKFIRSVAINYHLSKYWKEKIYLDRLKKQFYAVHRRNGVQFLIRLNLSKDGSKTATKITKHAYPEKVIVRNGYAYYTYKPNFDANLNKLYRQKL